MHQAMSVPATKSDKTQTVQTAKGTQSANMPLQPQIVWRGRGAQLRQIVCEQAGIASLRALHEGKRKPIMRARQVGMYLARLYTTLSYAQIARLFGLCDHTTARHAFEHIPLYASFEPDTARLKAACEKMLHAQGVEAIVRVPLQKNAEEGACAKPVALRALRMTGPAPVRARTPKPRKDVSAHTHPLVREFFALAQGHALIDIDEKAGFSGNTICNWKSRNTPYLHNFEAALNVLGHELCIRRRGEDKSVQAAAPDAALIGKTAL